MKNKVVLVIILLAFIGVIVGIGYLHSDMYIINIGNEIYGNDYCEGHSIITVENGHVFWSNGVAFVVTPYNCKICKKEYEHPNTGVPELCEECARITKRCRSCGKLEKEVE